MKYSSRQIVNRALLILAVILGAASLAFAQTAAPADKSEPPEIKIIRLTNASAKHAKKTLIELFPEDFETTGTSVTADERTNALILRGSNSLLLEAEAILLNLDQAKSNRPPNSNTAKGDDAGTTNPLSSRQAEGLDRSLGITRSPEFLQYEMQAQAAAQAYRQQLAAAPRDEKELARLKADLQGAVHSAFHARQAWQRKQVAEMRKRLDEIEKNVAARGSRSNEIIERRVEDLLNPERQWDDGDQSVGANSSEERPAAEADSVNQVQRHSEDREFAKPGTIPSTTAESALDSGSDPRKGVVEAENAVISARAAVAETEVDAFEAKDELDKLAEANKLSPGVIPEIEVSNAQTNFKRKVAAMNRVRAELAGKERLLSLAKEHLDAQIKFAELELKKAQVRLEQAALAEKRAEKLIQNNAISSEEYEKTLAASRRAALDVSHATTRYELLRKGLPDREAENPNQPRPGF
jgi:hypothetical protein